MMKKYFPCDIKMRILKDEKPDFGKFLANKDMSFIFYLDNKFKNHKMKFDDGTERYYLNMIEHQIVKHKYRFATIFEENFDNYIVVEPYVEDENGIFLADYKNFCVMHAQIANIGIVKLPTYPLIDPNGLIGFHKFKFWAELDSFGIYRLHYTSSTMKDEMKAFCFRSISINNYEYKDSYIAELKEIEERKEKELYLKLKEKFESV